MHDELDLVGRERELADIGAAILNLQSGHGGVRLAAGEPGIGKTRLLGVLATLARRAGMRTVWGRAEQPDAVVETARAGLAGGPVVVVVDDLHRLAPDGGEALRQLLELAHGDAVLLGLGFRPRQLPPPVAATLWDAGPLHAWRVAPLTVEHARRLLGDRADLDQLHRDAAGNPLYLHVLAEPGGVQSGVLRAELGTLTPAELELAQAAAVIGDPFLPEVPIEVSTLEHDVGLSALDRLLAADVLRVQQAGPLVAFRHPALELTAYQSISLSQRRRLHQRADRRLETDNAPVVARARHLANSADPVAPTRYTILARAARETLADNPVAATDWLETLGTALGPNDRRWPTTQLLLAKARLRLGRFADSRAALGALTAQSTTDGSAMAAAGHIERVLGRYAEAEALTRAGLARDLSPTTRAIGLIDLSAIASDRGDFATAELRAVEAVQVARQSGDVVREAAALGEAAWARVCQADTAGGGAAADAAARLVDAMPDSLATTDPDCLHRLGTAEALLDRLADARRHLDRGVRLSRETGQGQVMPDLLKSLAEVECRLGRLDRAVEILDELEPLAAASHIVPMQALAASIRARTLLWRNASADVGGSLAAAERALAYCADQDAGWTWATHVQACFAEPLIFAGEPGRARRVLLTAGGGELLPRVASSVRIRWWELLALTETDLTRIDRYADLADEMAERAPTPARLGMAHRLRASAAGVRGSTGAAIAAGDAAIAAFAGAGMLVDVGRTHVLVARAVLDAGRTDDVEHRLGVSAEIAARCNAVRLREQVEEQVARLAGRSPDPGWRATLTARERDIVDLVGEALSSGDIAARLHLSVRTVDTHLGRIYRKLGVPNRVALVNLINARS